MTQDVTILGAGIIGICCALSLRQRGVSVRLIDKGAPGQETSFGNAGVISPYSIVPQSMPGIWAQIPKLMFGKNRPLAVRPKVWPKMIPWGLKFLRESRESRVRTIADSMAYLCAPSVTLYKEHLKGTGHESLIQDSCYVHAFRHTETPDLTALGYAIRAKYGAEMEVLTATDLHALEPALSPDFKSSILIKGQARALAPGRIGEVLAEKARAMGVTVLRADIKSLTKHQTGWQITTDQDTLTASQVIVAMGAWSPLILAPLGLKPPLMAERGYHVQFPDAGVSLNHSVMDADTHTVLSTMEGGLRLAGQAEFALVDAPPDPYRETRMIAQAKAAVPELETTGNSFWMGRRPSFPDSLPALGEFPNHKGLFAAFGHSHYGLMMAPKTGEVLADMITSTPANRDLSPFNPDRFTK